MFVLVFLFPQILNWVIVLVSSLLFGLAHTYQGLCGRKWSEFHWLGLFFPLYISLLILLFRSSFYIFM
ncbi:hypothetical protein [Bacillus tequilensis]|uniref:hypothetical protein n=1 Tax=Bacillus tequilensis TaxID=227866 RepID=UPI00046503D4|nr:hypothetical protein [Bacillus tequilensis]